jgi:hypothetical protein
MLKRGPYPPRRSFIVFEGEGNIASAKSGKSEKSVSLKTSNPLLSFYSKPCLRYASVLGMFLGTDLKRTCNGGTKIEEKHHLPPLF